MHRGLRFISPFFTAGLLVLLSSVVSAGDSYYKWVDDQGNIHISDSLSSVPLKYRDQIDRRRFGDDPENESGPVLKKKSSPDVISRPEQPQAKTAEAKPAKKHEVRYTAYEGSARRIIVSAVLNSRVTASLAIDTGAPNTVISASLADKLGLFDSDHGRVLIEARGIGGSAEAVRTIIDTIEVGGARNTFVPAMITSGISDAFDGLLGMDFVADYAVTIDTARKVVVFEELPVNPEHPGGHDKVWWTSLFKEFAGYRTLWKGYSESLEKKIRGSVVSGTGDEELKAFADEQYREADKLFDKLNRYATQNFVPTHWKQY